MQLKNEHFAAIEALGALPTGPAARLLGIHEQTLLARGKRGEIRGDRTASGRWRWHVGEYLARISKNQPPK